MPTITETPAGLDSTIRELTGMVRTTRRRLRWSWVAAGVGLLVGATLLVLIVGVLLDLIVVLNDAGRWIAFAFVGTIAALCMLGRVLSPLLARLPLFGVALRIERLLPDIHNRLVTVLDLSKVEREPEIEPFFRAVVQQASERTADFEPGQVVDRKSLHRATLWALAPVLVLGVSLALMPRFVGTAIARVLLPWADIAPAAWFTIDVKPGDAGVLLGEPAPIDVTIDGAALADVQVKFTNAAGVSRTVAVNPSTVGAKTGSQFRYVLEKLDEPLAYRVYAGRTWTREYQLRIVERPVLEEVRLVVRPPAYASATPPVELPKEERSIRALPGSTIDVKAVAVGEVAEAFVTTSAERIETSMNADLRSIRWWIQDEPPPGAWAFGRWMWDWSDKFHRTHFEPHEEGETRHGVGFNPPIMVRADDVFVTHVFLDPAHPPTQILVEFNDGSWDHRAYWGEPKMRRTGDDGTNAMRKLGALPGSGRWVRLEIPARSIGVDGKQIREIAFCTLTGSARWDWFGVATAKVEQNRIVEAPKRIDLAAASSDRWAGGIPVDQSQVFTVQLRNASGHGNRAPESYRIVPVVDQPPVVRIDSPAKDLTLASAEKVPLTIFAQDDVGLAKVELLLVRQRETKTETGRLQDFKGVVTSQVVRAAVDLKGLDPRAGDVFSYRVRATDLKGQSAESQEYRITLRTDDPNAYDKQREKVVREKEKVAEKLRKLAERQREAAEKTRELAAKHEAPKPQDAEKPTDPKSSKPEEPKPSPLTKEEQKELRSLAEEEKRIQHEVEQVQRDLQNLLQANEMQASTPQEKQALAEVDRDLKREAAPDLKQASEDLRDAQRKPNDPAADLQKANDSSKKAEKDLDRVVEKMDRNAKLDQLANKDPNDPVSPEMKKLLDEQSADAAASEANEKLNELKQAIAGLQKDVAQEQKQQDRLATERESARKDDEKLRRTEAQQQALEGKAAETLQQVQEALGGEPPRDLALEKAMGEEKNEPMGDGDPESKPAGGESSNEGEKMPADQGKEQAGEKSSEGKQQGQTQDGKSQQGGDPNSPAKAKDGDGPPQFESLQKAAQRQRGRRNGDKPSARERRSDLEARQEMLQRDLDKAADALEQGKETVSKTMEGLQSAVRDPSKLQKMLSDPDVQKQLAAGERAQANRDPNGQRMQDGHLPGVGRRSSVAAAGNLSAERLVEDLAALKLQPRDREALLQGTKAQPPESYKPYVRDYYNRLSEIKPK